MKFSPDGKSILVMTNSKFMRLIDAFTGVWILTDFDVFLNLFSCYLGNNAHFNRSRK